MRSPSEGSARLGETEIFNQRTGKLLALAVIAPLALTACSSQGGKNPSSGDGPVKVSLWTHSAGNEGEMKVISQIIGDYNASQSKYEIVRQDFPQEAYNDSVQGAAASNDLPCILDVDGPIMPNWAWNGWLVPSGLTEDDVKNSLPSTVGRYQDQIYSVGYWDAATVIFTRKSVLEKNQIRVPEIDTPWNADEFEAAQAKIKASGEFENVIDWGPGWTGEWWSYAYSPLLQSFGGDLINRADYASADGVLNGEKAQAFAKWFQEQFSKGYASKSNAQDRTEFKTGKIAMQYTGIWSYNENFEAYGDDLVIVPAPDFGNGSKAGAGSWQYGVTKQCSPEEKAGALEYLKFSLQDKYVAQFSDVTALIPATSTAAEKTEKGLYGPGKPLEGVQQIAAKYALVRPVTPAYPVISQVFEKQLQDLVNGKDAKSALDQMVTEIDADIKAAGYTK